MSRDVEGTLVTLVEGFHFEMRSLQSFSKEKRT